MIVCNLVVAIMLGFFYELFCKNNQKHKEKYEHIRYLGFFAFIVSFVAVFVSYFTQKYSFHKNNFHMEFRHVFDVCVLCFGLTVSLFEDFLYKKFSKRLIWFSSCMAILVSFVFPANNTIHEKTYLTSVFVALVVQFMFGASSASDGRTVVMVTCCEGLVVGPYTIFWTICSAFVGFLFFSVMSHRSLSKNFQGPLTFFFLFFAVVFSTMSQLC